MAKYKSGVSGRWAYEIDRPRRARHGKNGCAERLIGSIRRECIDHIVVVGERHLLTCCNPTRTHLSLNKDAPLPCPAQIHGRILGMPILGGLHHQYVRV